MVDVAINSTELVDAFKRMRATWKQLFEGAPESSARRQEILGEVEADLATVEAAARISSEAMPFVVVAFRIRLGEWRVDARSLPPELVEAAEGVAGGLETRLRTLRQMESGDDILSDAGHDARRSAARDICFFLKLRKLLSGDNGSSGVEPHKEPQQIDLSHLSQCYDGRRKLVREEIAVPSHAVEAVEYLVRLGASG